VAIIANADLAEHLGVTGLLHDSLVANAVNAANQAVTQFCGRDFDKVAVASETARLFHPGNGAVAIVDDFWDTTNLAVKTDHGDDGTFETTWAAADYQLEPLNGRENGVTVPYYRIRAVESRYFPCSSRPTLQVTAAWGWAAVPAAVREATLIKAARLFHRKDSPQGVAGFNEFGVVRLASNDSDIKDLLGPFRRSEQFLMVG